MEPALRRAVLPGERNGVRPWSLGRSVCKLLRQSYSFFTFLLILTLSQYLVIEMVPQKAHLTRALGISG